MMFLKSPQIGSFANFFNTSFLALMSGVNPQGKIRPMLCKSTKMNVVDELSDIATKIAIYEHSVVITGPV